MLVMIWYGSGSGRGLRDRALGLGLGLEPERTLLVQDTDPQVVWISRVRVRVDHCCTRFICACGLHYKSLPFILHSYPDPISRPLPHTTTLTPGDLQDKALAFMRYDSSDGPKCFDFAGLRAMDVNGRTMSWTWNSSGGRGTDLRPSVQEWTRQLRILEVQIDEWSPRSKDEWQEWLNDRLQKEFALSDELSSAVKYYASVMELKQRADEECLMRDEAEFGRKTF